MREQKGYVFHRYNSWFVRYWDDVLQPDGAVKRVQVCKKLDVEYGGDYRTEKSVRLFVAQILAPLNSGLAQSAEHDAGFRFCRKILPARVRLQETAARDAQAVPRRVELLPKTAHGQTDAPGFPHRPRRADACSDRGAIKVRP